MNSTRTLSTHIIIGAVIVSLVGTLLLSIPTTTRASEDSTETETTTVTSEKKMKGKKAKVDATCMQTAVDTRETSLSDAWGTYTSAISSALSARKTALHDAWGLTDIKAQNKAIASAWKAWKKASQDAHKALKSDRKTTWDAFKSTTKTSCKISTPKDEALGADAAGSISL